MSHYVLRYREGASADMAGVEKKLAETEGVKVLAKADLMFLVDVIDKKTLAAVEAFAAGWLIVPERHVPPPGYHGPRPH